MRQKLVLAHSMTHTSVTITTCTLPTVVSMSKRIIFSAIGSILSIGLGGLCRQLQHVGWRVCTVRAPAKGRSWAAEWVICTADWGRCNHYTRGDIWRRVIIAVIITLYNEQCIRHRADRSFKQPGINRYRRIDVFTASQGGRGSALYCKYSAVIARHT